MNLNKRIDLIKKENQINLNKRIELIIKENQKYLNKESTNVLQVVESIENIIKKNEEMLTKSKTNDINSFENIKKDFFNQIGGSNINKKNEKKVDNKNPKAIKNEIKEDIIIFKGNNLLESLEIKLIKIFTEKSPDIYIDDLNDLKKICSALLIAKIEPKERINEFIKNNFNNFQNELDENNKTNLAAKKVKIFDSSQNLSLLNKIEAKDNDEFIKQFRDKYGITTEDYKDKDLIKLLKKGKQERDILQEILKKLKYSK